MRLMGGLGKKMPITSITMLIGCLSIAGFPFFSGFWSKDLVIETVFEAGETDPLGWVFMIVWFLAIVTAFMTAFYMFRLWFMTFRGEAGPNAEHAHGESPKSMTLPLMILSVFAFGFGFVLLTGFDGLLELVPSATGLWTVGNGAAEGVGHYMGELFTNPYTYLTIALVLLAIGLAYLMYCKRSVSPGIVSKDGSLLTGSARPASAPRTRSGSEHHRHRGRTQRHTRRALAGGVGGCVVDAVVGHGPHPALRCGECTASAVVALST